VVGYSGDNVRKMQEFVDASGKTIRDVRGRDFFGAAGRFFSGTAGAPVWEKNDITSDQLLLFIGVMFFSIGVIPGLGNLLGVLPTLKYYLTTDRFAAVRQKLEAKRAARGQEN
jgi:hypothetical protein